MYDFLTNNIFVNFVIPILTTGLSIFFKVLSRHDTHAPFRKEDMAVGLETLITALLLAITNMVALVDRAKSAPGNRGPIFADPITSEILIAPWFILAICLGAIGISFLIRKKGWHAEENMTLTWGIIIPDFVGLATLLLVVLWIRK